MSPIVSEGNWSGLFSKITRSASFPGVGALRLLVRPRSTLPPFVSSRACEPLAAVGEIQLKVRISDPPRSGVP